ncbi:PPM-type phosphatase domain-containing protein [Balamuthia mandrillaris]
MEDKQKTTKEKKEKGGGVLPSPRGKKSKLPQQETKEKDKQEKDNNNNNDRGLRPGVRAGSRPPSVGTLRSLTAAPSPSSAYLPDADSVLKSQNYRELPPLRFIPFEQYCGIELFGPPLPSSFTSSSSSSDAKGTKTLKQVAIAKEIEVNASSSNSGDKAQEKGNRHKSLSKVYPSPLRSGDYCFGCSISTYPRKTFLQRRTTSTSTTASSSDTKKKDIKKGKKGGEEEPSPPSTPRKGKKKGGEEDPSPPSTPRGKSKNAQKEDTPATQDFIIKSSERVGDPICDSYAVQVLPHHTIMAVADGCNWGEKPKEASRLACSSFIEYFRSSFDKMSTLKDVGRVLLRAFARAHTKILESGMPAVSGEKASPRMEADGSQVRARKKTTQVSFSGTTTLIGGVLLELPSESAEQFGAQWAFVCASVGDCKAFLYSRSTGTVKDITRGNRPVSSDMKDPGGRLGPISDKHNNPDLRNLGLFMCPCEEDSILVLLSDGIHDNLDPEHLGLLPKDLQEDAGESWDETKLLQLLKEQYRAKCFQEKVLREGESPMSITPALLTHRLIQHCKDVTRPSRKWMQANPSRRIPNDRTRFIGKMDHATCLAVLVAPRHFAQQQVGSVAAQQVLKRTTSDSALTSPMLRKDLRRLSNGRRVSLNTAPLNLKEKDSSGIMVTIMENETHLRLLCALTMAHTQPQHGLEDEQPLRCKVVGGGDSVELVAAPLMLLETEKDKEKEGEEEEDKDEFRVVGSTNELEKERKRVVVLPRKVVAESMERTVDKQKGLVLFTFTKESS